MFCLRACLPIPRALRMHSAQQRPLISPQPCSSPCWPVSTTSGQLLSWKPSLHDTLTLDCLSQTMSCCMVCPPLHHHPRLGPALSFGCLPFPPHWLYFLGYLPIQPILTVARPIVLATLLLCSRTFKASLLTLNLSPNFVP